MFKDIKNSKPYKYHLVFLILSVIFTPLLIWSLIQAMYPENFSLMVIMIIAFTACYAISSLVIMILTINKSRKSKSDLLFLINSIVSFVFIIASLVISGFMPIFLNDSNYQLNGIDWSLAPLHIVSIVLISLVLISNITIFFINSYTLKIMSEKKKERRNKYQEGLVAIRADYRDLYKKADKMKWHIIWGLIISLTVIGLLVYVVWIIIDVFKIIITDWKDNELNKQRIIWFLLSFFILTWIGTAVFQHVVKKRIRTNYSSETNVENIE